LAARPPPFCEARHHALRSKAKQGGAQNETLGQVVYKYMRIYLYTASTVEGFGAEFLWLGHPYRERPQRPQRKLLSHKKAPFFAEAASTYAKATVDRPQGRQKVLPRRPQRFLDADFADYAVFRSPQISLMDTDLVSR
jgi:hypothetical protein